MRDFRDLRDFRSSWEELRVESGFGVRGSGSFWEKLAKSSGRCYRWEAVGQISYGSSHTSLRRKMFWAFLPRNCGSDLVWQLADMLGFAHVGKIPRCTSRDFPNIGESQHVGLGVVQVGAPRASNPDYYMYILYIWICSVYECVQCTPAPRSGAGGFIRKGPGEQKVRGFPTHEPDLRF